MTRLKEKQYQDTERSGRGDHFARVPTSIVRSRDLRPMEKLAYAVLQSYDWDGEGCWPSRDTIAEDMGCSVSTADRALSGLVGKGLVEKRRRGLGLTNTYILRPAGSSPEPDPDSAWVTTPESSWVTTEVDEGEVDEQTTTPASPSSAAADPGSDEEQIPDCEIEVVSESGELELTDPLLAEIERALPPRGRAQRERLRRACEANPRGVVHVVEELKKARRIRNEAAVFHTRIADGAHLEYRGRLTELDLSRLAHAQLERELTADEQAAIAEHRATWVPSRGLTPDEIRLGV